eukprot:m.21636 g.21636  ORF g.21636 m.21636 type:complete len:1186 (+) comp3909_c0_seq2:62-3619(+)
MASDTPSPADVFDEDDGDDVTYGYDAAPGSLKPAVDAMVVQLRKLAAFEWHRRITSRAPSPTLQRKSGDDAREAAAVAASSTVGSPPTLAYFSQALATLLPSMDRESGDGPSGPHASRRGRFSSSGRSHSSSRPPSTHGGQRMPPVHELAEEAVVNTQHHRERNLDATTHPHQRSHHSRESERELDDNEVRQRTTPTTTNNNTNSSSSSRTKSTSQRHHGSASVDCDCNCDDNNDDRLLRTTPPPPPAASSLHDGSVVLSAVASSVLRRLRVAEGAEHEGDSGVGDADEWGRAMHEADPLDLLVGEGDAPGVLIDDDLSAASDSPIDSQDASSEEDFDDAESPDDQAEYGESEVKTDNGGQRRRRHSGSGSGVDGGDGGGGDVEPYYGGYTFERPRSATLDADATFVYDDMPPSLQPALREIAERVARLSAQHPRLPPFHVAMDAGVGAARSMSGGAAAAMSGMMERVTQGAASAVKGSVSMAQVRAMAMAGKAQSAANVMVEGAQGAAVAFAGQIAIAKTAAQRIPHGAASAVMGGMSMAREVAGSFTSTSDDAFDADAAAKNRAAGRGVAPDDGMIQQYAAHVHNFSSQYGLSSYSAENLAGEPRVFPAYGDYTQAYVPGSYGPWWRDAPAAPPHIPQTDTSFQMKDFIEVAFELPVQPAKITILETYHPGSISRILAAPFNVPSNGVAWTTLWDAARDPHPDDVVSESESHIKVESNGGSQGHVNNKGGLQQQVGTLGGDRGCGNKSSKRHRPPRESREFAPPLRKIQFLTNILRIELDHTHQEYYTQLDAVVLHGRLKLEERQPVNLVDPLKVAQHSTATGQILRRLSDSGLPARKSGPFDLLPDELIWSLLELLSTADLMRVSRVNRRLFAISYQVLICRTSLDLQPYWPRVTDAFLFGVLARCTNLRSLGLSWCGGGIGMLSEAGFSTFLSMTGSKLQCLRLASCSFLSDDSVRTIVRLCPKLTDLDMQCCLQLTGTGIIEVAKLPLLQRLNLQNTRATVDALHTVFTTCTALEHVNVGHCRDVAGQDWDALAMALATQCPRLKSLDLWRARTLTHVGVAAIADGCPGLISLDLGWCRMVELDLCIPRIAQRCRGLRKLFLTAIRNVNDECLNALAEHSTHLEQLDVLGSNVITIEAVTAVVNKCQKLKLLDVSFCPSIDMETVQRLQRAAPQLAIKKE